MRSKFVFLLSLLVVCFLAACSAETNQPTNVTATSAVFRADSEWDAGDEAEFWFEYRPVGGSGWNQTPHKTVGPFEDDGSASNEPSQLVGGFSPNSSYQYRICGILKSVEPDQGPVCYDSQGAANGTNYTQFTTASSGTPQVCNETSSAGESFSSLDSRVSAGEKVCLVGGTYNWGNSINLNDSGVTWQAKETSPGSGTYQDVTINGKLQPTGDNITLSDFKLVGSAGGHSGTLKPHGSDNLRVQHLEITSQNQNSQGIQVGGDPVTGLELVANKIHRNGSDGQFDHGIYCNKSDDALMEGNWIYRNASYGIQFYPDCDTTQFKHNVVANNGSTSSTNGRGIVLGGEGSSSSDYNTLTGNVIATYKSGDSRSMIGCSGNEGPGNVVTNTQVRYSPGGSASSCGGIVSGTEVGDPGFVNQAADDYRVVAGGAGQDELGLWSQFVPGPR